MFCKNYLKAAGWPCLLIYYTFLFEKPYIYNLRSAGFFFNQVLCIGLIDKTTPKNNITLD